MSTLLCHRSKHGLSGLRCQPQAADPAAVPVEAAEALLLWQDPWASAKVFGGGLYALICLRHLVFGARALHATCRQVPLRTRSKPASSQLEVPCD